MAELLMPKGSQHLRQETNLMLMKNDEDALHFLGVAA